MPKLEIIKMDAGKIIQTAANKVAWQFEAPDLIEGSFSFPVSIAMDISGQNKRYIDKLEKDKVAAKVLKIKVLNDYKDFKTDIEMLVRDEATAFFRNSLLPELDEMQRGAVVKAWRGKIATAVDKLQDSFAEAHLQEWNEVLIKYWTDREGGRVDEKKTTVKKTKAVAGGGLAVVGTGVAVTSTVFTLGAATPGLVGALYGTYLAAMNCYKVFNDDAKTQDQLMASILKTMKKLNDKYNSDDMDKHMRKKELAAKAMDTFLGGNIVDSIKKLEKNLALLRKVNKKMVLETSRAGKKLGVLLDQCNVVLAHCAKLDSALGAKELVAAVKDKKIEKMLKGAGDNIAEIEKTTKQLREVSKTQAKRLAKRYIDLGAFDDGLGEWEKKVQGWKEKRPDDIRIIGNCFTAMQILFQAGCAAGSMGASTASFVPSASQFAMTDPGSITDVASSAFGTIQAIGEAVAPSVKERVKSEI